MEGCVQPGCDVRSHLSTLREVAVLSAQIAWTMICSFVDLFSKPKRKSLRGDVVLVTGAGRGLGRELAIKFAREASAVVLWDIDEKSVKGVEAEIRELGLFAHAYACDVTDPDDVRAVGRRVVAEVGDVTVVVNNAGVLQNVLFTQLDCAKIRKTIEVNLLAHFWINKFFLPKMIELQRGHIVAIASMGGLRGWLYLADYSASKFGVVGLMEVLGEEIRQMGLEERIHFTTVCPITINTGMNQNPTSKHPSIAPILDVQETAALIVDSVRQNEEIISVPKSALMTSYFCRLLPRKVYQLLFDFVGYNMLPNKQEGS